MGGLGSATCTAELAAAGADVVTAAACGWAAGAAGGAHLRAEAALLVVVRGSRNRCAFDVGLRVLV